VVNVLARTLIAIGACRRASELLVGSVSMVMVIS
jgi:hypothetical protein